MKNMIDTGLVAANSSWGLDMGFVIFLIAMSVILWWLIGKFIYDHYLEKKWQDLQSRIDKNQEQADRIIERANEKADKVRERAELDSSKLISKTQQESANLLEKLNEQKDEVYKKEKELSATIELKKNKLYEIAQLDKETAKQKIFEDIEKEYSQDLFDYVEKIKRQASENAKEEANNIISKIIYRVASEKSNHFLVDTVELPSEDYKWKIIWREWRNVQFFEKTTWVEVSMDDTPEIVKISSFEPEKRFLAKVTMQRLIKDWRINPVYIEKVYNKTASELPEILRNIWKETLIELWIPMMDSWLLEYIWKFELRYSYWQNLLEHSKEVAQISELLANELWYDWMIAKRAWLLHDIWKIDVWSWESHAIVWADILRKFNMHEIVINAAESHHFEVEQTHPISWIVAAADAISAWREWVRNNNKERYFERMSSLENLVTNIEWIKKAYIMQAWREIRAFLDEKKVTDLQVQKLNKQIKEKIEQNLDYPWIIKVVSIRENKVIDYVW